MTAEAAANKPRRSADWALYIGLFGALAIVPVIFVPQLYDDFTLPKQAALLVSAGIIAAGLADNFRLPRGNALRIALVAWTLMLLVSSVSAVDWRGGMTGVYQYRQGLLTQVAYLVVFLGAVRAAEDGHGRRVLAFPAIGLAGVLAYTAIQALGRDPIEWWLDTSDRAIGTIGNANELSAYAIVALVLVAPAMALRRYGTLAASAVVAATTFIVLEAESRAGIAAIVAWGIALTASWWLAGNRYAALRTPALALGGGVVSGAVLSFAAGGLADSASRIEGGVAGSDAGGSTRISLWKGAAEVIRAHPVAGVGPDGLYLDFPVHRPEGLGGAYDSYDLVAQSSHNYALDTAANTGVPGLAALGGLVTVCTVASVRRTREVASASVRAEPYLWAGLAAYSALTLLNPISMPAHVLFFAVLGLVVARRTPRPAHEGAATLFRWAGFVPALLLALVFTATARELVLGDRSAQQGWDDYAAGRFEESARHYESAADEEPFTRHYAQKAAESWFAAAVGGGTPELFRARTSYLEFGDNFGLGSGDALALAALEAMLGNDAAAERYVDRALELNPNGTHIGPYVEQVREAIRVGGVLRYSERDRWTYIEPLPATAR